MRSTNLWLSGGALGKTGQDIFRSKVLGLAAWWFPEQVKKKATYGWRTSQDGSIAGNLIHPSINQTAGFYFRAGKNGRLKWNRPCKLLFQTLNYIDPQPILIFCYC